MNRALLLLLVFSTVQMRAAVVADAFTRAVDAAAPAGSPANFTNAVNQFNALSIDGAKRVIRMAPGTYALAVGTFRMHVSNNICIQGAGMNQTTITGLGSASNPMINLWDNCEMNDLTVTSSGTAANPQLGSKLTTSSATSTNVVVRRVAFNGDDDNLWLENGGVWDGAIGFQALEWTVLDCVFNNHFDSVFVQGTANGVISGPNNADGLCRVRLRNCVMNSQGPSSDATSQARGDVTNIRVLGLSGRAELYGCWLYSAGGTNTTAAAFLGAGPSGADSLSLWPGGVYFNNCQITINGTNMVSGGVGACLLQSTNGWVFLNAVLANSNNIVGNGTNFWQQGRAIASSTATVGTAADTLEKDLLAVTLAGNTWGADGQAVELSAWGSYGATANTKALRLKLGAASGSGSLTLLDSAGRAINGGEWFLRGQIVRASKTTLKASLLLEAPGFTTNEYSSVTLTVTTNMFLRLTGSNHTAAASDLVLEGYKLTHIP